MNKEEMKQRILSFMLYKGYIRDKTILQSQLEEDMKKEGWLDMPYERILSLLRQKGVLEK